MRTLSYLFFMMFNLMNEKKIYKNSEKIINLLVQVIYLIILTTNIIDTKDVDVC